MEAQLEHEGLEESLNLLEQLMAEHLGEENTIDVCLDCWQVRDYCRCLSRTIVRFWPLRQAILKLRMELGMGLV